mmetsp:Transcript_12213/g.36393  ORF Transcript_12213/g.36393 Transcript_12213/m.36393 type:complete len:233 (-) Transcript_12213:952-1650(-)
MAAPLWSWTRCAKRPGGRAASFPAAPAWLHSAHRARTGTSRSRARCSTASCGPWAPWTSSKERTRRPGRGGPCSSTSGTRLPRGPALRLQNSTLAPRWTPVERALGQMQLPRRGQTQAALGRMDKSMRLGLSLSGWCTRAGVQAAPRQSLALCLMRQVEAGLRQGLRQLRQMRSTPSPTTWRTIGRAPCHRLRRLWKQGQRELRPGGRLLSPSSTGPELWSPTAHLGPWPAR